MSLEASDAWGLICNHLANAGNGQYSSEHPHQGGSSDARLRCVRPFLLDNDARAHTSRTSRMRLDGTIRNLLGESVSVLERGEGEGGSEFAGW